MTVMSQSASRCPHKPPSDGIPLKNRSDGVVLVDTLHKKAITVAKCPASICNATVVGGFRPRNEPSTETLIQEANELLLEFYTGDGGNITTKLRMQQISDQAAQTGSFDLTTEELKYATVLAWRNAGRCIARFLYRDLEIFDCRHVKTCREVFDCVMESLRYSNANFQRPSMTIFPKREAGKADFRLWNSRVLRFAAFTSETGEIIGSPESLTLTEICMALGWKPSKISNNVPLPLVISGPDGGPFLFELPDEVFRIVKMEHPSYPQFESVGLEAFSVATVSDLALDAGGNFFPTTVIIACWIHSELAKNFLDVNRGNRALEVANALGADVNDITWRDKAYFETGCAILHSFKKLGMNIGHHYTYSEAFVQFLRNETKERGGCPSEWIWLASFPGSSSCSVYHQEMLNYKLKPCYEQQDDAWTSFEGPLPWPNRRKRHIQFKTLAKIICCLAAFINKMNKNRMSLMVVFASEGGKARFAKLFHNAAKHRFYSKMACMEDSSVKSLQTKDIVVVITSTFGDGGPPTNGAAFYKKLQKTVVDPTENRKTPSFAVLALGNRLYAHFCGFGVKINAEFSRLGWSQIIPVTKACELDGEDPVFNAWSSSAFDTILKKSFNGGSSPSIPRHQWEADSLVTVVLEKAQGIPPSRQSLLSTVHGKKILQLTCTETKRLTPPLEKSVELIRLRLPSSDKSLFSVGDYFLVYPVNRATEVERLRLRLNIDLQIFNRQLYNLQSTDGNGNNFNFPTCTLHQAFTYLLDIQSPPPVELLQYFASCEKGVVVEQLTVLASREVYDSWKLRRWESVVEFLENNPNITVDLAGFLYRLPTLKPRSYSISSSPNCSDAALDLTVGEFEFQPPEAKKSLKGLCSNYLCDLEAGAAVFGYFRNAPHFHLPDDLSVPLIFVGAGTGIVPFRGILQELEYKRSKGATLPPVSVYFGCRNSGQFLHGSEIKNYHKNGVISTLKIAFSKEIMYVHNALEADGSEIYQQLARQKGHVFVCGRVEMAANVRKALENILSDREKSLTTLNGQTLIEELKNSGRYHEDLFTTETVMSDKANMNSIGKIQ